MAGLHQAFLVTGHCAGLTRSGALATQCLCLKHSLWLAQVKRTKEVLSANTGAPLSVEELLDGLDFRSHISRSAWPQEGPAAAELVAGRSSGTCATDAALDMSVGAVAAHIWTVLVLAAIAMD